MTLAEHMLFYASEKYPLEDSYSKYIIEVINYLIIILVAYLRKKSFFPVFLFYYVIRGGWIVILVRIYVLLNDVFSVFCGLLDA